MKLFLIQLILTTFLFSCKSDEVIIREKEYSRHVGDIEFDAKTDNINFKICNGEDNILQYFNLGNGPVYAGEKSSILRTFKTKYKPVMDTSQNGLIRIRFIVNCEGRAGRFRVIQSDNNYKETEFEEKIISQLTEITKGIEEWVIQQDEDNNAVDYYHYLIFRIIDGQITEILP